MKISKRVVIIESVHEILEEKLVKAGFTCDRLFDFNREQLKKVGKKYFGLVIRSRITLDQDFIDAFPNLKFIARSGSGLENIDTGYAKSKGIEIFSSPEGNRDAVGEHAIGMLLMLLNNLHLADLEVRAGHWNREKNRGHELKSMTVGIIGYGVMGSGLAEKLSGFGCSIIAYDKYKTGFGNHNVTEVSLQELQASADVVSLHLALTEETRHYFNSEFLSGFKKPIYLINTARGAHVNTHDLIDGLESGQVSGACLDVLEFEKPSLLGLEITDENKDLKRLISAHNVVLSPHIAGWTFESYQKLSSVLADKILDWCNFQPN